jgi:hypothetical protein
MEDTCSCTGMGWYWDLLEHSHQARAAIELAWVALSSPFPKWAKAGQFAVLGHVQTHVPATLLHGLDRAAPPPGTPTGPRDGRAHAVV